MGVEVPVVVVLVQGLEEGPVLVEGMEEALARRD